MDPTKCSPGTIFSFKIPDEQTIEDYGIALIKNAEHIRRYDIATKEHAQKLLIPSSICKTEFILAAPKAIYTDITSSGKTIYSYKFVITLTQYDENDIDIFGRWQSITLPGFLVQEKSVIYDARVISKTMANSHIIGTFLDLLSRNNPCMSLADKYNKQESMDRYIEILRKNTPNIKHSTLNNAARLEALLRIHLPPGLPISGNRVCDPVPFMLDCPCGELFTIPRIAIMIRTDPYIPGMSFTCDSCLRRYEMIIDNGKLAFRDKESRLIISKTIAEDMNTVDAYEDTNGNDEEDGGYDYEEEEEEV